MKLKAILASALPALLLVAFAGCISGPGSPVGGNEGSGGSAGQATAAPAESPKIAEFESGMNNKFIPVKTAEEKDGVVTIKYELSEALGLDEYGEDIMYLFGAALQQFPQSSRIKIITEVGDETILECSALSKDLSDFINGNISGEAAAGKIECS